MAPSTASPASPFIDGASGSGGSRDYPSGGGGSSGGGPPSITLTGGTDAIGQSDGTYKDVIGDNVTVAVTSAQPRTLKTVTYTITGGAVLSQTYTKPLGSVTRYTTPITHTLNAGASADTLSFYWDEHARQHTLNVKVMYDNNNPENNGQPYTKTFIVDVEQPKVESYGYTRDSGLKFGTFINPILGVNTIGFFQDDPGDYFTPAVTTYKFGGTFALMETTNLDWTRTAKTSGVLRVKSEAYVIDPPGKISSTNNQELMLRGWSTQIGTNQFDVDIEYLANHGPANLMKNPPEPHYLRDNPLEVYAPTGLYPNSNYWTAMAQTWLFRTHIMYQRTDGIWVSLGRIDWKVNGSATFKDNQANPKSEAFYKNIDNWTLTWDNTASTKTLTTEIPTWTDQYATYDDQWLANRSF